MPRALAVHYIINMMYLVLSFSLFPSCQQEAAPCEKVAAADDVSEVTDTSTSSDINTDTASTDTTNTDTELTETTDEDTGVSPEQQVVHVYLLAGQSNMAGLSQRSGLPPAQRLGQPDVQLYCSWFPSWLVLHPSSPHNSGYGLYTGPEASFGRMMADHRAEQSIYLIKHAVSGTDLHSFWSPGASTDDFANMGEGYQVFQQTVFEGLASLEAQGLSPQVDGMLWMQGEADASNPSYAELYKDNLQHFIARVREDVGVEDLRFVVGKIACDTDMCPGRDVVRLAQDEVASQDPKVTTIETADLDRNHDDLWHYTGQSMRVLGMRFAEAFLELPQSPLPTSAVQLTGEWRTDYSGSYTVGWSFQLHNPITITDIGQIDIEYDGLNHDTTVAFWNEDTYELLLEGHIPKTASASTSLLGHFRSTAIDPVDLEPGNYIIALQSFATNTDWYVSEAVYSASPAVSHTGYRHAAGSVLSFPWYGGETGETGAWFGPNFWYLNR